MSGVLTTVAAVIVTYRRDAELGRLLGSLRDGEAVPELVVVDNAASVSTKKVVEDCGMKVFYEALPENPGPGAGWKRGMEIALRELPGLTHFLVLDDDVVLPGEAVARLVEATESAAMACPLLLDAKNEVWAFPEPSDVGLRKVIRQVRTPESAVELLGSEARRFVWCTGACVMIRREAVDAVGFHREDFRMLGEDLEYSMRVAAHGGGVFLPDLCVPHLPPENADAAAASAANRRKFDALLQNLFYLSFHSPHSGHLRWYLPGNARRYFRTFGWSFSSLWAVGRCLWKGAVRKMPAGAK